MTLASTMGRLGRTVRRGLRRPLRERVLFLHVPKCGGNSIRVALREVCHPPLSNSRRRFFHLSPIRSRRTAELAGRPVEAVRDDLLRYHLLDERVRLFTGHFTWPEGLGRSFPDVSLVTVLREPVARFLSWYYDPASRRNSSSPGAFETLEGFLDTAQARNAGATYARYIAGADPTRALEPEVIDLARERLARVDVLGVLEDLPGLVAAFEARFGFRLVLPRLNIGQLRVRREHSEVTDAVRDRIADIVRPDRILYDFVRDHLATRCPRSGAH